MSSAKAFAALTALLCCWGCGPRRLYSQAQAERSSGELAAALQHAQRGFDQWRDKPGDAWHWRFKLLLAGLVSARDTDKALELVSAEIPPQVDQWAWLEARRLTDRGALLFRKGNPAARDSLNRAYQIALQRAPDLIPEILIRQAAIQGREREFTKAEAYTREAITLAQRAGDRYNEANALGQMGFLFLTQSRFDEAIAMFSRSFAISKTAGYEDISGLTASNIGSCYFRLGDLDRAAAYYRESEISSEHTGNLRTQQSLASNQGSIYQSRGEYGKATAAYQRALDVSEHLSDSLWTAKNLDNLAWAKIATGELDAAERLTARSLALKSKIDDVNERIWPLLTSAAIAHARQDYSAEKTAYDTILKAHPTDPNLMWQVHAGLGQVHAAQGNVAEARGEYGQAVGLIDSSWARLLSSSSKLTFPAAVASFYHEYVDFLMSRGLDKEALEFAESRRARLLSEGIGRAGAPSSFQETAKRLDAVLLSYWVSPTQSYMWIVTPAKVRGVKLPPEPKLRGMVTQYLKTIDASRGELTKDPMARELYDTLVAPAGGDLHQNSRVILVPDGVLHGLNFETLAAPSGHYWLEEATVEIAPSLRLIGGPEPAAGKFSESILLIGDPIYTSPELPKLPHAAEEIRAIAQLFPNPVVLTGQAAQPTAYHAASPGKFGMIHFAAHALGNRESPLDSAVALSQGPETYKLYAREVQDTPLEAELVTVSACRSAGERTYTGEGLVGFSWAFLRAGARNVIASLWDVSDSSTSAFMKSLYAKIRDGQRAADALRAVKLEFLRNKTWQKPYYWAPFQVYTR